jgi:hypothetical protein
LQIGDGLDDIRTALAAIPDAELAALQATAGDSPQFAPGLLAFLSHACELELGRRRGSHFDLNGPHAAIDPSKMGASFTALAVLLATFDGQSPVAELLRATGDALAAEPPAMH